MLEAQGKYVLNGHVVSHFLHAGCTLVYHNTGILVLSKKPYFVDGEWRIPTVHKIKRGYQLRWTHTTWTFK